MSTYSSTQRANSPTLKRPFTAVTKSDPSSPNRAPSTNKQDSLLPSRLQAGRKPALVTKRLHPYHYHLPNMPVAAGPQAYYSSQLPSFMSVYGCNNVNSMEENRAMTEQKETEAIPVIPEDANSPQEESPASQTHLYKHRDSTSTQASESTDSSPTTTISTADSSVLTDPSPSSSPESPVTILPLSSFSSMASGRFGIHSLDDLTMSENPILKDSFDRPMTSPSPRKPRNAKGLALKLGSPEPTQQASAPASPAAFVKPPLPKPRRKPSNLSLQTSSNFNTLNTLSIAPLASEPPPTPSVIGMPVRRTLHHAASVSQLSMFSPDPRGLQAPMRLPAFERSQVSGLSSVFRKPTPLQEASTGLENKIEEEESPIRTQMASRNGGDIGGDSFDVAANEDAKSPGYPEGPVVIYEPHVYLYLEPTAEEASKFDVIMNVASEVKNPFTNPKPAKKESVSMPLSTFDSMDIDRDNIPEPATAATMATFRTAFEYQPSDASATPTETSPTTPKPTAKQPEYIHIPWEHNTDITKDLMWLCEAIDERVKDGKKVLIHCQQGASRSASLIIAYGMYRSPWLTVDAAYNAAQERSRWICPNINLMYALQDFHKALKNRRTRTGKSPTKHRMTFSADEIEFSPKEPPQTAPLPIDRDGSGVNRTSPIRTPPHMRNNSTPNFGEISPGPSSAPSSFPWTPKTDKTPNFGLWSDNTSPKLTFGSFNFKNESPNKYSAASNFGNAQKPQIDTPPSSQPASPPMLPGFASHRQEHSAKRKPAPSLLFKPLPPPPTVCETPIDNIKPQFASLPMVNPPVTPGLWSPRIQEMAGNNVQKSFGMGFGFGFGFGFGGPNQQASTQKHEHKHQKIEIEVPPTPSIMSPRVEGFNINPFAQVFDTKIVPIERPKTSLGGAGFGGSGVGGGSGFLGSLGFGGMSFGNGMMASFGTLKPLPPPPSLMLRRELERKEKGNDGGNKVNEANGLNKALPLRVDPRSPPLRGEAGIIRSIDDVL